MQIVLYPNIFGYRNTLFYNHYTITETNSENGDDDNSTGTIIIEEKIEEVSPVTEPSS